MSLTDYIKLLAKSKLESGLLKPHITVTEISCLLVAGMVEQARDM